MKWSRDDVIIFEKWNVNRVIDGRPISRWNANWSIKIDDLMNTNQLIDGMYMRWNETVTFVTVYEMIDEQYKERTKWSETN